MKNWGEFVSVTAETFKAGEVFACWSAETDSLAYDYVWTASGEPFEECMDDADRLACDVMAFTFACSVHGYGDSLVADEIESIGAQDIFENWTDELRAIAASLLTDPLRQPVSFMTLWDCSAGKGGGPDDYDYWTEYNLIGVIEPSAAGVVLRPLTDYVGVAAGGRRDGAA